MGVYVKNMSMPKSCEECDFCDYEQGNCLANKLQNTLPHDDRKKDWCPLVEVSEPHGRLIDEAIVLEMIRKSMGIKDLSFLYHAEKSIVNEIFHAPTVIEAEDE